MRLSRRIRQDGSVRNQIPACWGLQSSINTCSWGILGVPHHLALDHLLHSLHPSPHYSQYQWLPPLNALPSLLLRKGRVRYLRPIVHSIPAILLAATSSDVLTTAFVIHMYIFSLQDCPTARSPLSSAPLSSTSSTVCCYLLIITTPR